MPALDKFHQAVRNGLTKDGWDVADTPLSIKVGDDQMHIDLAAERILIAEKSSRKIAVEIKSFMGPSKMHDLEQAIGQYFVYKLALRRMEPDREMFLAVPEVIVVNRFQNPNRPLWGIFLMRWVARSSPTMRKTRR